MTLQYSNPVTNQVRRIMAMAEDKQPKLRPYTPPSLIANIEAEASDGDQPDDVAGRLGIPPQGDVDFAAANAERIANAPKMYTNPDAPTLLAANLPTYVPPTLEGLIANERAAKRRPKPNYAGAAGGPAGVGSVAAVPPYVAPAMRW